MEEYIEEHLKKLFTLSILRLSEEIEEPKQELTELKYRFDTFDKKLYSILFRRNKLYIMGLHKWKLEIPFNLIFFKDVYMYII